MFIYCTVFYNIAAIIIACVSLYCELYCNTPVCRWFRSRESKQSWECSRGHGCAGPGDSAIDTHSGRQDSLPSDGRSAASAGGASGSAASVSRPFSGLMPSAHFSLRTYDSALCSQRVVFHGLLQNLAWNIRWAFIILQALRFKLHSLNQTCTWSKSIMQLTKTIFSDSVI